MLKKLKQTFKESFFYSFGNFVAKASGLILLPLYGIYISKSEIGLLALYESAYMFLLVISGWGAKGGFTRWYNEMKSERQRKSLFFTTYVFNVLSSTLGIILTALVLFNLNIFENNDSGSIILLFSFSSIFRLLFDVPFILLKLQQKAFKQTAYQSFNIAVTVILTFYQLEIKKSGFEGIFIAQLMANAITMLAIVPLIVKNSYWQFQYKVLKEMINYGYPIAISNILTLVLTISDRYILEAYYSLEAVGSFSIAIKVANLLQVLVVYSFVTSYTFQYYKSMYDNDSSRFYIKTFTYFVLVMVLAGFLIVLFGKEIIYVIMAGKKEYYDAIPVIPLLIIGLIFSGMRQVFILPITKAKKTKLISVVMILTGLLNLALNFLIIPVFGKEGAAITTAISQLFAALWFLLKVNQLDKTRYEWRKISLLIVTGAIICVLYFFIPTYNIIIDITVKLVLMALFFIILYIFHFFEEVELLRIKEAWGKWKNISALSDNFKSLKK